MTDHFVDITKMVLQRLVLSTPAPWDEGCDKTSTPADQ